MKTEIKRIFVLWVFAVIFVSVIVTIGAVIVKNNFVSVNAEPPKDTEIEVVVVQKSITEVEDNFVSPRVEKIIKEVEYLIDKEVEVLKFPFEVEDLGTYTIKYVNSNTLPKKLYPNMRAKEGVTVFASSSVMPEGTLLWIENVGIRRVQTVYSEENVIFVYSETENFEETNAKVYKIME